MIEGVILQKNLLDGRIVAIVPLTFSRARITIGRDEETYENSY